MNLVIQEDKRLLLLVMLTAIFLQCAMAAGASRVPCSLGALASPCSAQNASFLYSRVACDVMMQGGDCVEKSAVSSGNLYSCMPNSIDTLLQNQLRRVDISGSQKRKTLLNTAPEQIVGVQEMEKMGARNVSEAVRQMAGVTLHDYGGAGGLKTVSVRGLSAQFTGVSYDGVALSDVQSGRIDLQRYTLNGLGRLRLLVGDGADIFISAREAVMPSLLSIETQPIVGSDSLLHAVAQMNVGAWGYCSPMLAVGKRLGKLSLSVSADYLYAENDYPFTIYNIQERVHKRRAHSMMNQGHVEVNGSYRIAENHQLSAKLYYYDNDRHLPGVVRYYTSESQQQLHERTAFAQASYNVVLSPRWSIKGAAKYNWSVSNYSDRMYPDGIMDADYWQREGYVSAAVQYKMADGLQLCYASDGALNTLNSHAFMLRDQKPRRWSVLNTLSARWNRQFFTLTARLLRSDYFEQTKLGESARDYHRWSPSLSASVRLGTDVSVRMMWKQIFRMPSFSELYYYHFGGQNLRPERTDQWNLGFTWQRRVVPQLLLSASADAYVNTVRDKIVTIPYNMFIWHNINVDKVDIKGADITAEADWTLNNAHSISLQGHYSYISARSRNRATATTYNKQLSYMPCHSFSSMLSWENPWVGVSVSCYGVSRTWATNEHVLGTHISGYAEWGATLFRSFVLKRGNKPMHTGDNSVIHRHRITASVGLTNIFNKQYEIVAAYPMPGVGWRMKVCYEF